MWGVPTSPFAEKVCVEKRTGKRTVRPERVVLGGSDGVASGFAGTLLGWLGGLTVSC
jgi:hypothetical protein